MKDSERLTKIEIEKLGLGLADAQWGKCELCGELVEKSIARECTRCWERKWGLR
jgi:hypothetical protein